MLKVRDLTVEYDTAQQTVVALDGLNLDLLSGQHSLGIVGESGSGKTTLGLSIMKLIQHPGRISKGSINFDGIDILRLRGEELRQFRWREVSMVFQSAMNSLNPVKTIIDHITEVILEHVKTSKAEARETSSKLLADVGIPIDRIRGYPHEFSGGMRQRAVIAMALALSPKLLIADEPTSALDVVVQRQIIELLKKKIKERGLSMIFITHEIALIHNFVEDVAVMYKGEIVERGPAEKVLSIPLHPYSEMLIGSLIEPGVSKISLKNFGDRSKLEVVNDFEAVGCKYASRCRYAFTRCEVDRPKLLEVEKGRWVSCHKYSN
jgi:peptide/nickel transport system ATP-binding protein